MKKTLPKTPQLIDDYRLKDYFGNSLATKFLCKLIIFSNGEAIQKLVIDRLHRKNYTLKQNENTGGFFDCMIDGMYVEIRRTTKTKHGLNLYMGNTGRRTNTYHSRKEKVDKLIDGGYIFVRVMSWGKRLKIYWLPTRLLVSTFGELCYSRDGISIKRLNKEFNLDIPVNG